MAAATLHASELLDWLGPCLTIQSFTSQDMPYTEDVVT